MRLLSIYTVFPSFLFVPSLHFVLSQALPSSPASSYRFPTLEVPQLLRTVHYYGGHVRRRADPVCWLHVGRLPFKSIDGAELARRLDRFAHAVAPPVFRTALQM